VEQMRVGRVNAKLLKTRKVSAAAAVEFLRQIGPVAVQERILKSETGIHWRYVLL